MGYFMRPHFRLALMVPIACLLLSADLHVWVDEEGRTHITDDGSGLPPGALPAGDVEAVRGLWGGDSRGEPLWTPPGWSGRDEDRVVRVLRDAVADLGKGEAGRAGAALRSLLRSDPDRPEPHFYLALIEGGRGHLEKAEDHLRTFLSVAGDRFDPWRASAEQRLAQLEDERELMDRPAAGPLRLVDLEHQAFQIQADAELLQKGEVSFARTVARYLDDARSLVGTRVGAYPAEPTGVVLYGKAAYVKAHAHRFSFQTVGFFDGRIHVVSKAHPAGELRTLLVHEYTHALFREQTGGDRPFWLNEGLAEIYERASQRRVPLSRGERTRMRSALDAGGWIDLRRLAPSFAGLDNREARLAYAIATFAADWIERHSTPAARAQLLRRIGEGWQADDALREAVGVDTAGLEASLQAELRGSPLPAAPR
ncbi:MAG: hypothetical protein GY723_19775 [bacterium]|nr:hypothetical protein [bacterium]MCP5071164.1 hypothetical protein [bacterium]